MFHCYSYGFAIIYGIFALASGVCFFLEARKSFDELMRRDEEYTRAVLEMSQATYPMASYGAPSYAPSYPDYQSQPSYSDEKKQPSYSTQPSYGGQSGYDYGGEKAGYASEKPGYGGSQSGYNQPQPGYAGGSQSGYDPSQPGYGQSSYSARA